MDDWKYMICEITKFELPSGYKYVWQSNIDLYEKAVDKVYDEQHIYVIFKSPSKLTRAEHVDLCDIAFKRRFIERW